MFPLDKTAVAYQDPWWLPLDARLAALGRGDRRVAYLCERPEFTTFRYRVYNMTQALHSSEIGAAYFTEKELQALYSVLPSIDTLVVSRMRYADEISRLVCRAADLGKRVLFDLDDLVCDPEYVPLLLHTLDEPIGDGVAWDHWFAYVSRIRAMLRLCDGVIVTNQYLASCVEVRCGKPTVIVPNFFNRQQLAVSESILARKRACRFVGSGPLAVGYFSGTNTHNNDLQIAAEALSTLLARNPQVELHLVGPVKLRAPLIEHRSRIHCHALQDFVNLQRFIGAMEINLAPLQNNTFTNCKSELKYFEAAITGTITIASPTFAMRGAIRDGENGYLARSFEWLCKLEQVQRGTATYQEMAERAFVHARQTYGWDMQRDRIAAALFRPLPAVTAATAEWASVSA